MRVDLHEVDPDGWINPSPFAHNITLDDALDGIGGELRQTAIFAIGAGEAYMVGGGLTIGVYVIRPAAVLAMRGDGGMSGL
jgi:hypothetical protein